MSKLVSACLLIFFLQTCKNNEKTHVQLPTEVTHPDTVTNEEKRVDYSIRVEEIDSSNYNSIKNTANGATKKISKITNYQEAKKRLEGIVEFDEEIPDYPCVKDINFRNGKKPDGELYFELDACLFIAYFPEEDILLCEVGNAMDVSFNLTSGKETEETGNPDLFNFSPNANFRLNGHFGGEECYSYFIEKKINNEFVKIIQLDDAFEKLTKHWLCTIGESFWTNENTLYLTETEYTENGISERYFKLTLIEN